MIVLIVILIITLAAVIEGMDKIRANDANKAIIRMEKRNRKRR